MLNFRSSRGVCLSYLSRITKYLSKLHGSLERIRSTSSLSSNMNRTLWDPSLLTVKPLSALQSGLNVLATASILNARLVKNWAAIIHFFEHLSFLKHTSPPPSFSNRERQFHCLARSSIDKIIKKKKKESS